MSPCVLNLNAPNTYTLRTLLLAQALYILDGVLFVALLLISVRAFAETN